MLRPEGACQKRFSSFSDWSPEVQKRVNLVDLAKSFPTSISYLLTKIGFGTAEDEPLKIAKN